MIFDLDGTEVTVEKVLEAVAARRGASAVQRRVDDLLGTSQVSLPTELKPFRYLLTARTTVPADAYIQSSRSYQSAGHDIKKK